MLQKTIYVLLAFALLLLGGCKESDDNSRMEVSPEPFLGQWQEIARGNETYPELTPDGHVIEFLKDGTMPPKTYHSAAWIAGREETDHYPGGYRVFVSEQRQYRQQIHLSVQFHRHRHTPVGCSLWHGTRVNGHPNIQYLQTTLKTFTCSMKDKRSCPGH
jgi:hypothetical protein